MPTLPDLPTLEAQRRALLRQLTELGDLRPGSLTPSYRKCGRSTCQCARPGARGHGPQWLLTAKVNGKTRTRTIPAAAVDTTRAQIAECQRLRRLTAALIAVSEDLCHTRLRAETARGGGAVAAEKKRVGRRNSPRLRRPNSTGS